jgi:hypothetical protein
MPLAVIHSRDDDGCAVVGVPISNRPQLTAWLYAADYERITTDHAAASWLVNDNGDGRLYVRLKDRERRNNVMVSRLVLHDPTISIIRYRDGDRLNLRSRNLDAVRPAPQRRVIERPNRAFRGLTSLPA